jgi:prepilin-type N-terminal cleavage/methylation domain-containing protein
LKKLNSKGFTIVEVLVVLSIIAILIGLLYPALKGGLQRARKTTELNSIRQVGAAWSLYSASNLDRIMPGYIGTGVQERWDVAWAYPDETLVPPAPLYDISKPNVAGPWPWRILDRMNNRWETLVDYKKRTWNNMQIKDHAEVVAVQPAFGYNGYYLGGFWEIDPRWAKPTLQYSQVLLQHGQVENVVATVGSQMTKPTELVVFCSSFFAQTGEQRHLLDDTDGYFLAVPRILANELQWEARDDGIEAFATTSPPLGRFNGLPAVFFADGHVDDVSIYELEDQRKWIPKARDLGNIPARDFSHSE